MNAPESNIASAYRLSYDWLLKRQPPEFQAEVLAAVNSDTLPSKEVVTFIKRVIALAESGN